MGHFKVVTYYENGCRKVSIPALQELNESLGLGMEVDHYYPLRLPNTKEGFFDYVLCEGSDMNVPALVGKIYFCDTDTGEVEPFAEHNRVLETVTHRRYFDGRAEISGTIGIDDLGRVLLHAKTDSNIVAEVRVEFSPDSCGYLLRHKLVPEYFRLWSDGENIYISPSAVFEC